MTMDSFARFLVAMDYPAERIRNPVPVETHGDEDKHVDFGPQQPVPGIQHNQSPSRRC